MRYLLVLCFLFQLSSLSALAQEFKYHTVKAGETVYSISKSYNISEEAIFKYNPDARANDLEVSSKLVIPLSKKEQLSAKNNDIKFIAHKVKRKETLYRLSKDYNVEIDEIKRYNKHLYSKELRQGEEILIPQREQGGQGERAATNTEIASSSSSQISETREHVVLPKETKYGIARKYGLTVKELEELNPKVDVLQPGVMIRVGTDVLDEPVILTDEVFEFYEVKPKETLFGLSRKFHVPQDSLITLNPALENGLKIGMVLKVPNTGVGEGNLEEGETEELAGDSENLDANKRLDLFNKISNFNTQDIVVLLPYKLNKVNGDSIADYKDLILDDRVSRISLDFYSGVLMAVEEAKSMGISTRLRTFDTRLNVQEVHNIINANDFSNVDVVIGPLVQSTIEATASKLTQYNVPVISPISNREMRPYQNLFQSRPTDEILKNKMFDYLKKNTPGKNVIIIADGAKNQVKNQLSQLLPNSRIILPSEGFISAEKIRGQLSSTQENWVILESSNVGLLSSATSALNRLARNHEIKLFTTNKNSGFEDGMVENQHLGRLNFHYPSVDKEHTTAFSKDEFIEEYKEKFKMVPNQYVVRGYDLTLDILLRLASAEDLYESIEKHTGYTEYHENKFHYTPKRNAGFYNDAVYIMNLDEELNLKVANDQ